jgi:membrane protease YdiL (CAAX protease family)
MDQSTTATLTIPEGRPAPVPEETWTRRQWRTYVTNVRADADSSAAVTPATDRKMVAVFVTAAVALTLSNFLADDSRWLETLLRGIGFGGVATRLNEAMVTSSHAEWNDLAFWAVVNIAAYVIPPVLMIRYVLRERVRDYGLHVQGILPHAGTYVLLFAMAAPLIIAASFTTSFQEKYPFWQPGAADALWPYLFAWWLLYWLQFCALEFFFRGFLVHGLVPRLGWAAIFAMALPYNMLHFGKPMLEAFAAIVGGIVLGTLSIKTKSIWWGAALHISIALTMDLCALAHLGRM